MFRFRGDVELPIADRINVVSKEVKGDKVVTFSIDKVTAEDAGIIKAIAKNIAGEDKCQAKLTIKGRRYCIKAKYDGRMHTIMYFTILVQTEKPKFLKKPTDVEVVVTEDAMFEIEVDGKPKPEIQW